MVSAFHRRLLTPSTLPWETGWMNVTYHLPWGLETPGTVQSSSFPMGAGGTSRPWPTELTESHAPSLSPHRQHTAWAPAAQGPVSEP